MSQVQSIPLQSPVYREFLMLAILVPLFVLHHVFEDAIEHGGVVLDYLAGFSVFLYHVPE